MKGLIRNCILALGSLIVTLAIAEVVVRTAVPPVSRSNYTPVPSTIRQKSGVVGIPYRLKPNGSAVHDFGSNPRGYLDGDGTLMYRVNSLGLRGPETTRRKPKGVFRIIGVGDSFTFGTGVREEHTFIRVLERKMNASRDAGVFEILNFGVGGYNTVHEVNTIEHVALGFEPDAILLCFFLNDTGAAGTATQLNPIAPVSSLPAWRRHFRLIDHLATRVERRLAVEELIEEYHLGFAQDAAGWVRTRHELGRAKRLCDEHGVQFFVTIFPVLWSLANYPFAEIHAAIAAHTEGLGIPTLDLAPAFEDFEGPELWAHPNNQHPNPEAHEIAATALHRFLEQRLKVGE